MHHLNISTNYNEDHSEKPSKENVIPRKNPNDELHLKTPKYNDYDHRAIIPRNIFAYPLRNPNRVC